MTAYIPPPEIVEIGRRLIGALPLGRKKELAAAARVTKQALVNWERNGVPPHRAHVVAEFFGIDVGSVRPDIFKPRDSLG